MSSPSKVRKSVINIDSSDSGDDLPSARLSTTAPTITSRRVSKNGSDSSSSTSDDDAPQRSRAPTRLSQTKVKSAAQRGTVPSDSDSTSSGEDKPSQRASVKPKLPDSDSSDSDGDPGKKLVTKKKVSRTPPRRVTPPTDSDSESDVSGLSEV